MISLHTLSDLSSIDEFKTDYLQNLTAPMDGMWDTGFTNPAPHWEIRVDDESAGYVAVSGEGVLLQLYVAPKFQNQIGQILDHVIAELNVETAVVSTIDPDFLSVCLDRGYKMKASTFLYGIDSPAGPEHPESESVSLRLLEADELQRVTDLQNICFGAAPGEHQWLDGYSTNLLSRNELYVLECGDEWIGLGELRRSDTQPGVADVGVMIDPKHRRNGWAAFTLSSLVAMGGGEGLQIICSTTHDNPASQKAINRAGFHSRHRILDVSFGS